MSGESPNIAIILFKGQELPFEQVYKSTFKSLLMKARIMLNDLAKSEDVVQDLFMTLWERKNVEIKGNSIEAYLMMGIHYRCWSLLNKQRRVESRMRKYAYDILLTEQADFSFSSDDSLLSSKLNLLKMGWQQLSHNQREAIKKIFEEDKSYKQAAAEMNIKKNTLNSHLERSLGKFRNLFQQECSMS
ncbi:RNA polymerase sigma factor [Chitinophaga filiformis]|uniref:RNA polymerase sigma-70 factor, ECF subfamily n=1 Tax=Chitinophaga filiformis TaxID=104663 RepID=A0A1G7HKY9_CHIFI|nr:sigma-70 family RNA polymerase sigma factor [Chitinophaga filiformis]SDF01167.1 RNA polymerase sigma-70 factor, ECF subfamily [Chitinophaga filiformis]